MCVCVGVCWCVSVCVCVCVVVGMGGGVIYLSQSQLLNDLCARTKKKGFSLLFCLCLLHPRAGENILKWI